MMCICTDIVSLNSRKRVVLTQQEDTKCKDQEQCPD